MAVNRNPLPVLWLDKTALVVTTELKGKPEENVHGSVFHVEIVQLRVLLLLDGSQPFACPCFTQGATALGTAMGAAPITFFVILFGFSNRPRDQSLGCEERALVIIG